MLKKQRFKFGPWQRSSAFCLSWRLSGTPPGSWTASSRWGRKWAEAVGGPTRAVRRQAAARHPPPIVRTTAQDRHRWKLDTKVRRLELERAMACAREPGLKRARIKFKHFPSLRAFIPVFTRLKKWVEHWLLNYSIFLRRQLQKPWGSRVYPFPAVQAKLAGLRPTCGWISCRNGMSSKHGAITS